ncbi:MAG: galactose mutarotase [Lachnospiraceae bacterium]|nr:galactose mutarotase [Lachnospiraceae bacterium]
MKIDGFGVTKDNKECRLFTISNDRMSLSVTDFGATMVNLNVQNNRNGMTDILLGYDDVKGYEEDTVYLGCNVGRCANRIAKGEFKLNGEYYELDRNDNPHCLHSGYSSYSKRMWRVIDYRDNGVTFGLISPHMDQGFPGELNIKISYTVTDNGFEIDYKATTDADTVVNLTNHSYFNLNGHDDGDMTNCLLRLNADHFAPITVDYIPTGEIRTVHGTAMDFRVAKSIGRDIDSGEAQVVKAGGYDHNFCVGSYDGTLKPVVKMNSIVTGIEMQIATDYPGVQVYSGNMLNGVHGKKGCVYEKRSGICFEPQYYPNAVNQYGFLSPILHKGTEYYKRIRYSFS